MKRLIIDSAPYREPDSPLPWWYANWCLRDGQLDAEMEALTMGQWRETYNIAKRYQTLHISEAMREFHLLPSDMLMIVRTRWTALRGHPLELVDDESLCTVNTLTFVGGHYPQILATLKWLASPRIGTSVLGVAPDVVLQTCAGAAFYSRG